jgi:hypothetical protein
MQGG